MYNKADTDILETDPAKCICLVLKILYHELCLCKDGGGGRGALNPVKKIKHGHGSNYHQEACCFNHR